MNVLQERLSQSALHLFVMASIFLQFISVLKLGIIIHTFQFLTLFYKVYQLLEAQKAYTFKPLPDFLQAFMLPFRHLDYDRLPVSIF